MENQEDMVKMFTDKISEIMENIKKPNIIVVGKTGVGKSTLINNVFRENLEETGSGRPVTQHLRRIERSDIPVVLYDTRGLELKETVQEQIKTEIIDIIIHEYFLSAFFISCLSMHKAIMLYRSVFNNAKLVNFSELTSE